MAPKGGLPIRGDAAAHRVLAATCCVLAGLISAHEAHHRGGARELALQIHDFLEKPQAREHLDAVHADRDVAPAIVDALIALEPCEGDDGALPAR